MTTVLAIFFLTTIGSHFRPVTKKAKAKLAHCLGTLRSLDDCREQPESSLAPRSQFPVHSAGSEEHEMKAMRERNGSGDFEAGCAALRASLQYKQRQRS